MLTYNNQIMYDHDQHQHQLKFLEANRYEVQENAVFLDYGQEVILQNLQNFKGLNIYQRTGYAKNIASVKQVCNDNHLYFKFLLELASDCEAIQLQLISFLNGNFSRVKTSNNFQKEYIEPLIKLIVEAHLQIKQQSCQLLATIIHDLSPEHRKQMMKLALELERHQQEDCKIAAIQIIARLCKDLKERQTENYFTSDFQSLYSSSNVRIKKEIINNCPLIGESVSSEFLDQEIIKRFYAERCRETVWGIRKNCVQILPKLVKLSKKEKLFLENLLFNFTKDGNKIVKLAAFKIIPEFIANYQQSTLSQGIINLYIHLADHQINKSVNRQDEIISKIVFYFPAVLHTLGHDKWHMMQGLFHKLLYYKNEEIKMSIASSLHEISKIIGPQQSKEYIFPAFNIIFKQPLDSLKLAAITNISEFISIFDKQTRQNLIDIFMVLQKDPKKWRMRYEIAKQLAPLSQVYDPETIFRYIFPISLKLCNDSIDQVRLEVAHNIYYVIQQMNQQVCYEQMARQSVKGYGLSEQYIQRQTFARMVRNLYKLSNFKEMFLDLVMKIAKDEIILVKISLAISISQILLDNNEKSEVFKEIINILKKDVEDVSQYFE